MKRWLAIFLLLTIPLVSAQFMSMASPSTTMLGGAMTGKPSYMRGAFTAWDMAKQMRRIYSPPTITTSFPARVAQTRPQVSRAFNRIGSSLPVMKRVIKIRIIRLRPSVLSEIEDLSEDAVGKRIPPSLLPVFGGKNTLLYVDRYRYTYEFGPNKLVGFNKGYTKAPQVKVTTDSKTADWILDGSSTTQQISRATRALEDNRIEIETESFTRAVVFNTVKTFSDEWAYLQRLTGTGGEEPEGGITQADRANIVALVDLMQALLQSEEMPCDELREQLGDVRDELDDINEKVADDCEEEKQALEQAQQGLEDAQEELDNAEEDAQELRDRIIDSIDGATYDPESGFENEIREKSGGYFRVKAGEPLYLSGDAAIEEFHEKTTEQFKEELEAANDRVDEAQEGVDEAQERVDEARRAYEDCLEERLGEDGAAALQAANDLIDEVQEKVDECEDEEEEGPPVVDETDDTGVGIPVEETEDNQTMNETEEQEEVPTLPEEVAEEAGNCSTGPRQEVNPDNTEFYEEKNTTSIGQLDGDPLGNYSCAPATGASAAKDLGGGATAPDGRSWLDWMREKMGTQPPRGTSVGGVLRGLQEFLNATNQTDDYNLTLTGHIVHNNGTPVSSGPTALGGVPLYFNFSYPLNGTQVKDLGFGEDQYMIIYINWVAGQVGDHFMVLEDYRIRNENGTRKHYISFMDPQDGQHHEAEINDAGCFEFNGKAACLRFLIGLKPN